MREYAVPNLIEAASSSNSNTEELLRRTQVIASRLNLCDLVDWCKKELRGYQEACLPDYRILCNIPLVPGKKTWQEIGLQWSFENNQTLSCLKTILQDPIVTAFEARDSVSQLITPNLQPPINPRKKDFILQLAISRNIKTDHCFHSLMHELRYDISASHFIGILSRIENNILDWAINLENNGILGENLRFSLTEKEKAMNNTIINNTNNFHGNVENTGTIGAGNSGDISQTNSLQEAKWESLKNELETLTVSSDDIQILRNELQNTSAPQTEADISRNIWKWLGRVGAKVSEPLLYSAISSYLGIPISP